MSVRRRGISKGIILTIYCICIFVVSIISLSALMNRGNTDMTTEMSEATYPLVSFVYEGRLMNMMHGFAREMDISYLRDTITPLMEERSLSIRIDTYGTGLEKISYEVRTLDNSRLIENNQVYNYLTNENTVTADITLKDLLEDQKEYSFSIILETTQGSTIHYYTRIIKADQYRVAEKLDYVYHFNDTTFDKYAASNELPTYLESNSKGDNTSFHRVDIHSSLNQVAWGTLPVKRVTEPVAMIREIGEEIADIEVCYYVSISQDEQDVYYAVEDYYRIKHGEERFYLLDYERITDQIFDLETATIANNKIVLGITDDQVQIVENSDGNRFAFVNAGRLYSYNITDNKIAEVFGFYDHDVTDLREVYQKHNIKIFRVDETGNIYFMVYGYMNRGSHEGEMGIVIYYYDSVLNIVEEKIFIPYDKSFEMLECDLEQLSYVNNINECYLYLDHCVYQINMEEHISRQLVYNLPLEAFVSSASQEIVAWASGADLNNATQIVMYDLSTGKQSNIEAEENTRIRPIGFFEEDFIYGVARKNDIMQDATGKLLYPMYKVLIRDSRGNLLKEYEESGYYVVDTTVDSGMITLERMQKTESGNWVYATKDQILDNQIAPTGKNTIETVVTENYEKIVQIVVRKEINLQTLQVMEPKQVLFEEDRTIVPASEAYTGEQYYLYLRGELNGIYESLPEAVTDAYEQGGVVVDDDGNYLYRKIARPDRNQIMAIGERSAEDGDELAVCLNTMLTLEGYTIDTSSQLQQGKSPEEILENTAADLTALDLNGCQLDTVLYYVAQDIPVLARLTDGSAVLVIGYNDYQVVIMNPATGTIYKKSIREAGEWFEENGNWFMTYQINF